MASIRMAEFVRGVPRLFSIAFEMRDKLPSRELSVIDQDVNDVHWAVLVYIYLYPSCKKSCDLIGQEQVSISHINL